MGISINWQWHKQWSCQNCVYKQPDLELTSWTKVRQFEPMGGTFSDKSELLVPKWILDVTLSDPPTFSTPLTWRITCIHKSHKNQNELFCFELTCNNLPAQAASNKCCFRHPSTSKCIFCDRHLPDVDPCELVMVAKIKQRLTAMVDTQHHIGHGHNVLCLWARSWQETSTAKHHAACLLTKGTLPEANRN